EPVTLSILSFVGIIWAINLFNFLDGIDGFIGMETAFIALAAFALFGNELLLILAAAILGFLILNWHPAKIFMGDVGSTFLGFLFAVFCIHYNNLGESSVFTWLILSGLFWFDATYTLYRRWRNGENLSVAHKKHAYQRMVQSGFSHQKTTLYALLVNLLLFAPLALTFYYNMEHLIFIVFLADLTILFLIMKWVDRKKSFLETQ
ncbi:MAG: hypothetical protein ACLFM7_14370, partial [Bacteroidales bacterium]